MEASRVSERRVVTVLFADMAGSTAIFEKLDPEIVTDVMNELFEVLGAEVTAVDGHVDKVVGDELMALFGAPVAHEDDALRAVRAALAMQRAVQGRAEALRGVLGVAPRLRIGIHAGQVVWGVVGPPGQARPTVMGDVVNLAARLQRAAPEGGVLVSEPVARQIRGAFLTRAWEPIVVKGRAEPVAVYEVVGERERVEPMHRPPFVDREADLDQLTDLFARARRGRAQVAVVSGDPGVGKTRLVEEFLQRLPEGVRILQTTCPPYGGQSLGPLADLFRQLAGLAGPATVADVEAHIPLGDRAARAALIISRLFNLAPVPLGDEVTRETALLVAAEAIRLMIDRPTVVWIEDLQWADAGSRELLPFVMERVTETPLLLVGNLRTGEEPPVWGKRTPVVTMQLAPLSTDAARALLEAILGERLPAEMEHTLVEKAGGNPFYLSEILATLQQSGMLTRDDRGRWLISGAAQTFLPDTVQGALLARLDRLTSDQRTLIQKASVVGVSFTQSLLADLSPGSDIPRLLSQLEEAYLIRRRDPLAADPEYLFIHPLLRDVAFGSLLLKHQAALHLQVAETLERRARDHAADLAKTIGTHFDHGGAPERALPYLFLAGRQAAQQYATGEAIALLERARAIARDLGQRETCADVCELLGDLYARVQERGPKEEFSVWNDVLASVDAAAEPVRAARAAIRAADALTKDNLPAEARRLLANAARLLPDEHPLQSDLLAVRAYMLILESEYRDAVGMARRAVEMANRLGGKENKVRAYSVLGHPALLPLLGAEGRSTMRRWVDEVAAAGDERLVTDTRHYLVSDMWTRGLVDADLLRLAADGVEKAVEYGWTRDEVDLRMMLGWGYFLTGQWAEAAANLDRAQAIITMQGGRGRGAYHILLPYFRGNLALGTGRLEEARGIFEEAIPTARFHAPIWLNHDLGRCLAMLGDLEGARSAMEQALLARDRLRCVICGCQANGVAAEFYAALDDRGRAGELMAAAEAVGSEIGHVTTRIRVRRARAHLALAAGDAAEAVTAAREALALGEGFALAQPFEQGQTWWLLGRAHAAARQDEQTIEAWRRAREIFAGLGAAWHREQVEAALRQGQPHIRRPLPGGHT